MTRTERWQETPLPQPNLGDARRPGFAARLKGLLPRAVVTRHLPMSSQDVGSPPSLAHTTYRTAHRACSAASQNPASLGCPTAFSGLVDRGSHISTGSNSSENHTANCLLDWRLRSASHPPVESPVLRERSKILPFTSAAEANPSGS